MSDNDDIEKLLREIDGVTGNTQPQAQPPARRQDASVEKADGSSSGTGLALAVAAAVGVIGLVLGFLPWVPGIWLGLGGFLGAFIGVLLGRRFG